MNISSLLNRLHHAVAKLKYPMYWIRHNHIGSGCFITSNVLLHGCTIGRGCYIGNNSILNNVRLGAYCSIAPNVQIGGMEHAYWDLSMSPYLSNQHISNQTTEIGHDVWVAAGAIIKQGIHIGDGAVIGAHAVVTKDVEPYSIYVGIPAHKIKNRLSKDVIDKLHASHYWEYEQKRSNRILQSLRDEIRL